RDLSAAAKQEYQIQDLALHLTSVHLGETPTVHLNATGTPHRLPLMLDGRFGPLTQRLEIQGYDFMVGIGKTAIRVSGALLGGKLDATLSAPSISSADLPVTLPLTKPVEIRALHVVAHAPYPLKQGVSAMELADVADLALKVQTGGSALDVKGTMVGGHAKVTMTSPSINTADLPGDTPFAQSGECENI